MLWNTVINYLCIYPLYKPLQNLDKTANVVKALKPSRDSVQKMCLLCYYVATLDMRKSFPTTMTLQHSNLSSKNNTL